MNRRTLHRSTGLALACFACVAAVGCAKSDKSTVAGRITLKDGTPVAGVRVMFRSNKTGKSARGLTDADGNYELTSLTPGDGIVPGTYYVTLGANASGEGDVMSEVFNPKYVSATQELIFEIEPGKANRIDMQLDPP